MLKVSPLRDSVVRMVTYRRLAWIIIALGVLLRVREYLFDRSLWLDESMLAFDLLHSSLHGLLKPLAYYQTPPVAFALTQKLVIQTLGSSEYSFRLVPLLAGVASLPLFYLVAIQMIAPRVVPIALGLFAIAMPLVYYSSEAKQYSLDVLIVVGLYALVLPMLTLEKWTFIRLLVLGLLGASAIWFSDASVFILGGIGLALGVNCLAHRRKEKLWSLTFPCALWAGSFGLCYWEILRYEAREPVLLNFWQNYFVPFPPRSIANVNWYIHTLFELFEFPCGIAATGLAVMLFGLGCARLCIRRSPRLSLLIFPIVLALAASAMHRYPFVERLTLFLAPALILPIAAGVEFVWSNCSNSWVVVAIVGVLFFMPIDSAAHFLHRPTTKEEFRPVLNYIRTHEKPGDVIYLSKRSAPSYLYYAERMNMGPLEVADSQPTPNVSDRYSIHISRLRAHQRAWILLTDIGPQMSERPVFLYRLSKLGKKMDSFQAPGVSVYLYSFPATPLENTSPLPARIR